VGTGVRRGRTDGDVGRTGTDGCDALPLPASGSPLFGAAADEVLAGGIGADAVSRHAGSAKPD